MDQSYGKVGIKHVTTSTAHTQANGQVERMNQTIIKALRRTLPIAKELWPEFLQTILMDYRMTPQDTTGYSPSQLLYGRQMRPPIEYHYDARESEEWDKAIKKRIAQLESISINQDKAAEQIKAKQRKMKAEYDQSANTILTNSKR